MDGSYERHLHILPATEQDVSVILDLIRQLAEYEKLSHEVSATEEGLLSSLFGPNAAAEVLIARVGAEPIGFAVFFQSYSTFLGRAGVYLEDLFIAPRWRGQGHGRALLAHVARIAVDRRCGRLEWAVLDWNEPALRFYRAVGARAMDEWTVYRLTGDALERLASSARGV